MIRINEIFFSIQGESTFAGRPCVFVRLSGCNLRCNYCDTTYAFDEGSLMSVKEIVGRVLDFKFPLAEITGGEPLMQESTPELVNCLIKSGITVLMETNGSYDIRMVDGACVKIVDVKCPGSGQSKTTDLDNLNRLGPEDQVKFVICDRADYDYAKSIINMAWSGKPQNPILFSPVEGLVKPAALAQWILEDRLDVRLQLQLHRIIWPEIDRGV